MAHGDTEQDTKPRQPPKKAMDRLVAVPRISFQKPSDDQPKTEQSEVQPTGESTASAEQPRLHGDREPFKPTSETTPYDHNVYASSFVPQVLRDINMENGMVVNQVSKYQINYQAYIGSFAGSSFLPQRPSFSPQQRYNLYAANETSYLEQMVESWKVEIDATAIEQSQYSLYKVPLHRHCTQDPVDLFSLIVPGLRENSPLVELGDTVQLRPLMVHVAGHHFVDNRFLIPHYENSGYHYRFWTGISYNVSVYGIHRAAETVYLQSDDLQQSLIGYTMTPLLANVMFPLKGRTVQTLQKSLAFTDCALVNAETHLWRAQNPGFNDINNISYTIGPGAFNDGSSRSQSMQPQEPIEAHTAQTPNSWIRRILLPNQRDGRHQTELRTIPHRGLFDAQLNYEQSHAVNSVCESDYGVVPYLISGPPGTGKTKTLVEIAMQLLNTHSVDHLLICAPSDQAADTLALRLKKYLKPTELLRLNGPWRPVAEVNEKLTMHGYTYMEDDMFYLPPFKQFMAYNVVVTSCGDASILMEARLTNMDLWTLEYEMTTTFRPERKEFPALHWGAILVDEAAQATELDVLSAINVGCPPQKYPNDMAQPRFIMAGDENQLGPRTASRYPPFVRSLFARLLDRPLYKEHPLSRSNMKPSSGPPVLKKSMLPMLFPPFTNLIRNYRSHPAIISVPSSLFYNDTLLPEAPISNTSLQRSSLWEGRQWPVLFVPNKGRDEIEQDGGGWYNKEEGKKACSLAQTLVSEGVQQADICIMAPFAAQVKILRNAIRSSAYGSGSGLWDVNIGPLEAFQGLEKRVVIICITRSRSRFVADDIKRGLGILHFPRKMNVALTRAKEALIVIGNPSVLKEDTHWLQWMSFCSRNGLVAEDVGIDEVEIHGGAKIGVLEKALLARDEKSNVSGVVGGKVLGGGAVVLEQDFSGEYDAWAEALREALDEEDESEEQDGDEEEEEEEGEGDHDGHGVVT